MIFMQSLKEFEKKIGYTFKNKALLSTALTHSSYANEHKMPIESNERLEFLGDSILGVIVSEDLFHNYKQKHEGELTKLRATLVCESSLHKYATKIDIGEYMMFGKGEKNTGGKRRPSILADAFEALIAAIYLDGGMENARKFVHKFTKEVVDAKPSFSDYKTRLQEIVQQNPEERLEYVLSDESGPDHDKSFTVEVRLNNNVIGKGTGKSKKLAEQRAALEALKLMGMDK